MSGLWSTQVYVTDGTGATGAAKCAPESWLDGTGRIGTTAVEQMASCGPPSSQWEAGLSFGGQVAHLSPGHQYPTASRLLTRWEGGQHGETTEKRPHPAARGGRVFVTA